MGKIPSLDVLFVEDDLPTARVFSKLLASIGVKVRLAKTVAEAIAELNREPDLIVLDLMLPDGSGVEVLKQARNAGLRSIVAVVSGANDPAMFAAVQALSPDAIFGKPLDFDDFADWLSEKF
jgi:CheY-like chemotaxis protein